MDNWEGENIRMNNITVHPDYDGWTIDNDFAVVILERATTFDIKYPTLNADHSFPSVDTLSTVIGWGTTEGGSQSNVLLEADLPIISNKDCDKCQSQYGATVTSNMICGFDLGHGACYGDSGEYMLHRSVDCIVTQEKLIAIRMIFLQEDHLLYLAQKKMY
jgi:secreted trypsin-like serine protease